MRKIKGVLVGAVVLGLMAIGASSAAAVTVSPAGPIASKSTVPINFETQSKLTCPETVLGGIVNSDGSGYFNNIALNGCYMMLGAPAYPTGAHKEMLTFTPMSGWLFQISRLSTGTTSTAFSNVLLRFALTAAPECSIDIGGTWNSLAGSSLSYFQVGPKVATTHLTVTRSSSCARILKMAQVGEAVAPAATVGVSPLLHVTE